VQLTILDHIPEGLLERSAPALYQQLDGPTLIHLPGRRERPLFVSVLQHGNEATGWEAVRRLLKSHYQRDELPRGLSLFIGNVEAARHQMRHMDHQRDFNRCWPGGNLDDTESHPLFQQVTDEMRRRQPFASVDIHNNTGMNPHYAAVNRIDYRYFHLATLFSNTVIFFRIPHGVQSNAFADFCPSVTLECGQAGDVHGTDHSMVYLETLLHLDELYDTPQPQGELDLFHMVATVRIAEGASFGFLGGKNGQDINFITELDHLNFTELRMGTVMGYSNGTVSQPIRAVDLTGQDVTNDYFAVDEGVIKTHRRIMPSMLTIDSRVIQQDCLCYLMERLDPEILRRIPDEPYPEPTAMLPSD